MREGACARPASARDPVPPPGSGVDNDGAAVVIQTAARVFLAHKGAAALKEVKEAQKEAAAHKVIEAAADVVYFPPVAEYTLAELLDAAFPDLEDMFSAEELLALWGEFEADKTA